MGMYIPDIPINGLMTEIPATEMVELVRATIPHTPNAAAQTSFST